MGLFDNIMIDAETLPVSNEDKKLLKDLPWQTKDLNCYMDSYKIKDGKLYCLFASRMWDAEADNGFLGKGRMITTDTEWQPIDFSGRINFYHSDKDDKWWEFVALFESGELIKIENQ